MCAAASLVYRIRFAYMHHISLELFSCAGLNFASLRVGVHVKGDFVTIYGFPGCTESPNLPARRGHATWRCGAAGWRWNTSPKTTLSGHSARPALRRPGRKCNKQHCLVTGERLIFVLREGEAGRVYFYQNELPYDVDQAG